ncbi:MAG: aminotransferase class III-fold pyridoxal phosphate-dependent enzyme, partial [Geminicoccaceae bacterium]|nr:aminotransferase class III-fold pyridoxal phosphate-dependent enzyme [Geminicoccaceae bacterium]
MTKNEAIPTVLPVYNRIDLVFERGEGAWLYTNDGRKFLDFASGIAVTGLGHAHPHLVETLQ